MARTMQGSVVDLVEGLAPTQRARVDALLESPTQQTWELAYAVIVGRHPVTTLWQAVCRVDPSFPSSRPSLSKVEVGTRVVWHDMDKLGTVEDLFAGGTIARVRWDGYRNRTYRSALTEVGTRVLFPVAPWPRVPSQHTLVRALERLAEREER